MYKNKHRERIYENVKQGCSAAYINDETVMDWSIFHRVHQNTSHLHSPLSMGLICVLKCEEKIRKEMEEKGKFVCPS